ncbi:skpo-1 [Acrasis kona]|uniref:Skpo-1 n=1 Tax=Acrasis kona TaxID=1008807 RepID=A0AAW2Z4K4_9EUKA
MLSQEESKEVFIQAKLSNTLPLLDALENHKDNHKSNISASSLNHLSNAVDIVMRYVHTIPLEERERVRKAASEFQPFTYKIRQNMREENFKRSRGNSSRSEGDREFIFYDGPDDPDRYNGGGDFDDGVGYCI